MPARTALLVLWFIAGIVVAPKTVIAEWYLAGTAGVNFADRINTIGGTGPQAGLPGPFVDRDLQNSLTYGAKVGYFPGHSWYGIEGEVLHTTPHIKNLGDDPRTTNFDDVPGIHFRLTTVGVNFLARYPGRTFQPYAGAGIGAAIARVGGTTTIRSDTDVAAAWNLLVGLRAFLTPHVAVFTEYKYQGVSLQFDQAFGPDGGFAGNYRAQHIMGGLSYHF